MIRTGGSEKQMMYSNVVCTGDGRKLPPYIIFKRKNIPKIPVKGIFVRANAKEWMDNDLVLVWVTHVWQRRLGALLNLRNMLVLDSFHGHTTHEVQQKLQNGKTDLVIIPGGLTSVLQPQDVCVNRPFKAVLKQIYAMDGR